MPKSPAWSALPLPERPAGSLLSDWLHQALRTAIVEERLLPGARLPSSRSLAVQLGVSRGTVSAVYEALIAEGYVIAKTGDGTRVLPSAPSAAAKHRIVWDQSPSLTAPVRLASRAAAWQLSPFPQDHSPPKSFRANIPSVTDFPLDVWSRLMSRRLRLATRELLLGCDPLGYPPLRDAMARHLRETRGLQCSGSQIMIVSGTQMALDLTARLLLDPGDAVWVEDPGYPGASRVMAAAHARVVPIPVDREGMKVALARRREPAARLAIVTAAHQFPLGMPLSPARRKDLLQWAREQQAWIFEDDYDSEFRFSGRPLMGLQGMPGGDRVLFSGSFSKMLFPGIRLGFLVLPPPLVEPFRQARALIDRFPATLDQAVLCDFITEGHFERHLRRMRLKYLERYTTLVEASRQAWAGRLIIAPNDTGLQTIAWLEGGRTAASFRAAAAKTGYEFVPLTEYCLRATQTLGRPAATGLQVGFGALTPQELRKAIRAVSRIL